MKNTNAETRETLQELYKEFKGDEVLAATMKVPEKKKVDKLNAVSRQRATHLPVRPACPSRPLRGVLGEGARGGPGICLEGGGRDPSQPSCPLGAQRRAALRLGLRRLRVADACAGGHTGSVSHPGPNWAARS